MSEHRLVASFRPDEAAGYAQARERGYCAWTDVHQRQHLAWEQFCRERCIPTVEVLHRAGQSEVAVDVSPRGAPLSEEEAAAITAAVVDACRGSQGSCRAHGGSGAHRGSSFASFNPVPRENAEALAARIVACLRTAAPIAPSP